MSLFELDHLISRSISRFQDLAAEKNIQLEVVDDLASYVTLSGNQEKFSVLLDTVFNYAVNHSGASHISFSSRQLLRHGREVLLEFLLEENGISHGIPKSFTYLRHMASARILIEEMKGKSEIITSAGQSTTLKFIIQCTWEEIPIRFPISPACRDKHILVVEDNEINLHIITHILSAHGMNCSTAEDGKQAIEWLEKNRRPDLILMDLNMPHMDGLQAANYIRKKISPELPIIGMLTGSCSMVAAHCLEVGMNAAIKKPFAVKELLSLICRQFEAVESVEVEKLERKVI